MDIRELPDLTPTQVVELVDALLANADTLLTTALTVLEQGQVPLARSLAILGMEESGKAIAVHERRVQMTKVPDGEPFRCEALDRLWGSHHRKLEKVHDFLVEELDRFGTEPSDPTVNTAYLGTIRTRKEARPFEDARLMAIIRSSRPDLLEEFGVGPIVAATLLCAWSHPGRIHSEAAFAMLAGVAPIPANSGQVTTRYRLNRYGDGTSTTHYTPWRRAASSTSQPPATTSPAAPPKARPAERSNAALPATWPETFTAYSKTRPRLLDEA